MTKTALFCALAAMACAMPARSQMISPMLYNGPRISLQDHADRFRSGGQAAPAPRGGGAAANPAASAAALTYRPDPARRRANLAGFVEKVRPIDPQGAANLANIFAMPDFMDRLQADLRPFGLDIANVADAYTVYWITAYQATRGESGNPPRPTVEAVKAQAARALIAAPAFAQANDAAKQQMAEALLIQAAMLDGAVKGSVGNAEQMRLVGRAAAQGALGMGIDLARMTLTDQGFVPKAG